MTETATATLPASVTPTDNPTSGATDAVGFESTATTVTLDETPIVRCVVPEGWLPYTVQAGNTLFRIGLATGSTVAELRDVNCLENADVIFAGQQIFVPRLVEGVVQSPPNAVTEPVITATSEIALRRIGCADPQTQIVGLFPGQRLKGIFTVFGTATAGEFDYYKLEIRPDFAEVFNFYDRFEEAVIDGLLGVVNTRQFGPGLYWLRLVVVDRTGNFATPCVIPLIFE